MAEIRLHGIDIEFDSDHELCFNLATRTDWIYLRTDEARQLRDFLNEVIPNSGEVKS